MLSCVVSDPPEGVWQCRSFQWTAQGKSDSPAAENCVFRTTNAALLSLPCHALQGTLPAQRSCLYVHLILARAYKIILNTDFVL